MYKDKKVTHIVARGLNGEIGANNRLLWGIPEDLKFFKDSTIGHVVLMGRKTVESLPKPLERRVTLCVSSNKEDGFISKKHALKPMQLPLALSAASWQATQIKTDCIFVAGGSQLFNSTFDIVDELWITQVFKEYPEADRFYQIPNDFEMFEEVLSHDTEDLMFTFQKWKKVN